MTNHLRLALCLTFALNSSSYSTNNDGMPQEEQDFRNAVYNNRALRAGMFVSANVTLAWNHQKTIREIASSDDDLSDTMKPDGQIETRNNMGQHWGYSPSITVSVDNFIRDKENVRMLEIGSCYGFDSMALVQRHPNLRMTTVELSPKHVEVMRHLMPHVLTEEQQGRLDTRVGDFRDQEVTDGERSSYDLCVISKVLHFYGPEDNIAFLTHVRQFLKPSARVIMTHLSNQVHPLLRVVTENVSGGMLPFPESIYKRLTCQGQIMWTYFFNKQSMDSIATKAGYRTDINQYIGSIHNKAAASYWWIGGINLRQNVLHTELVVPVVEEEQSEDNSSSGSDEE